MRRKDESSRRNFYTPCEKGRKKFPGSTHEGRNTKQLYGDWDGRLRKHYATTDLQDSTICKNTEGYAEYFIGHARHIEGVRGIIIFGRRKSSNKDWGKFYIWNWPLG